MRSDIEVAIVGAGIAGLAAAVTLARAGRACAVFEREPEITTAGVGIQLAPNGMRILDSVGLREEILAAGVQVMGIEYRRWLDGRSLGFADFDSRFLTCHGAPYCTVHRRELQRVLSAATLDGPCHYGRAVVALHQRRDGVEVSLDDGDVITAQLVLVADGIKSKLYADLFGDGSTDSGFIVHRGVIEGLTAERVAETARVLFWLGPQRHMTAYPISGAGEVHFSAVSPSGDHPPDGGDSRALRDDMKRSFQDWSAQCHEIFDAATTVGRWRLRERAAPMRLVSGRIVFIGDAAHPLLPYISQGANQALEDVAVLADCLKGEGEEGFVEALRDFERRRLARLQWVHETARRQGRAFHLPDGLAQRQRDDTLAATGGREPLETILASAPLVRRLNTDQSVALAAAGRSRSWEE